MVGTSQVGVETHDGLLSVKGGGGDSGVGPGENKKGRSRYLAVRWELGRFGQERRGGEGRFGNGEEGQRSSGRRRRRKVGREMRREEEPHQQLPLFGHRLIAVVVCL
ncbi:unnamed protein product [Calypogeia fissa]